MHGKYFAIVGCGIEKPYFRATKDIEKAKRICQKWFDKQGSNAGSYINASSCHVQTFDNLKDALKADISTRVNVKTTINIYKFINGEF